MATIVAEAQKQVKDATATRAVLIETPKATMQAIAKGDQTAEAKAASRVEMSCSTAHDLAKLRHQPEPTLVHPRSQIPPPPPLPTAMEQDTPFSWVPEVAIHREPTPPRRSIGITPPRARDGSSRSPLGKTHQEAKDNVKNPEAAHGRRINARDAAIVAARRLSNLHGEPGLTITEAFQQADALRLHESLHRLLYSRLLKTHWQVLLAPPSTPSSKPCTRRSHPTR